MKFAGLLLLLAVFKAHAAEPIKACAANQLSVGTDDENGSFRGVNRSGTLLVLRNIGAVACSVQPFPVLRFQDGQGTLLAIAGTVEGSRFLHPGPVVLPPVVPPGAEVTLTLRWVSGGVSEHGSCAEAASVALQIGSEFLSTPYRTTICGEPRPTYTMTRLRLDPAR